MDFNEPRLNSGACERVCSFGARFGILVTLNKTSSEVSRERIQKPGSKIGKRKQASCTKRVDEPHS